MNGRRLRVQDYNPPPNPFEFNKTGPADLALCLPEVQDQLPADLVIPKPVQLLIHYTLELLNNPTIATGKLSSEPLRVLGPRLYQDSAEAVRQNIVKYLPTARNGASYIASQDFIEVLARLSDLYFLASQIIQEERFSRFHRITPEPEVNDSRIFELMRSRIVKEAKNPKANTAALQVHFNYLANYLGSLSDELEHLNRTFPELIPQAGTQLDLDQRREEYQGAVPTYINRPPARFMT